MTLSHHYLGAKLDVLDKIGFVKSEALDSLGLMESCLNDARSRLPIEDFIVLLETAAERLDDPHLGLRMGHKFRIANFGQTGAIYGYCRDLKQVIAFNRRYQCLAIDAGEILHDIDAQGHHMRFRPYYTDQVAFRHVTDMIMGAYGTAYRWLSWGSGEDLAGVQLPYAAPDCLKLHDKVFQCPLQFESEGGTASLVFHDAAMSQTLPTHDPERLTRAMAQLDLMLGARTAIASLDRAVDEAIRGALQSGRVTTHVVAQRMGRNWSDLNAELKSTDRSFRERVDAVRQALFVELQAEGRSFAQIAQALAYNDQSAFNRAFKRWYGMSPTAWSAESA